MIKVSSGVYRLRSLSTDKFYIGSTQDFNRRAEGHFRSLGKGTHHNVRVQKLYDKLGEDDLVFEILHRLPIDEARIKEDRLIKRHASNPLSLNLGLSAIGGDNLTRHPRKAAIIKQMTSSVQKRMDAMTAEERKLAHGLPGEKNGMYGRHHTGESKAQMSELRKGKPNPATSYSRSEETKSKMKAAAQKRINSPDYKNSFEGRAHSEETRSVLSQIATERVAKGILPCTTLKIKVGKKKYRSASVAAADIGCSVATVLNRARSAKFPDYQFVD